VERKVVGEDKTKKYDWFLRYVSDAFPDVGKDDVVYVYGGHGAAGRDSITWPGDSNPIDSKALANLVAGRINETGFAGRIKVYSCFSGDGDKRAFARLFAEQMRAKSYLNCRIFGYHNQITQAYEDVFSTNLMKLKYKGPALTEGDTMHRWSVVNPGFYQGRLSGKDVSGNPLREEF
jgi:hypothetical protein